MIRRCLWGFLVVLLSGVLAEVEAGRHRARGDCTIVNISQYLRFEVVSNAFNYSQLPLVTGKWYGSDEANYTQSASTFTRQRVFGKNEVYRTIEAMRMASTTSRVSGGVKQGTWYFEEGNPCGFHPQKSGFCRGPLPFDGNEKGVMDIVQEKVEEEGKQNVDQELDAEVTRRRQWIEEIIRGKNILFVGDSQVRNQVLTLAASLCNPLHATDCGLAPATLNAYGNDGSDPLSCFMDAARTNICPTRGPTKSDEDSSTVPPYLEMETISFGNLTMKRMYQSRKERKLFWSQGLTPPMTHIRVPSLGTSLFYLSSTCDQTKDGICRVLQFVKDETDYENRELVKVSLTGEDGPKNHTRKLPQLDMILGSAGSHCTYKHASLPWFKRLAWLTNKLMAPHNAPFVWIEPFNCVKGAPNESKIPSGKETGATSCSYLHKDQKAVSEAMAKTAGFYVAPMRLITQKYRHMHVYQKFLGTSRRLDADEESWECAYIDGLHPAVKCSRDLNMILLQTMRLAFEDWGEKKNGNKRTSQTTEKETTGTTKFMELSSHSASSSRKLQQHEDKGTHHTDSPQEHDEREHEHDVPFLGRQSRTGSPDALHGKESMLHAALQHKPKPGEQHSIYDSTEDRTVYLVGFLAVVCLVLLQRNRRHHHHHHNQQQR